MRVRLLLVLPLMSKYMIIILHRGMRQTCITAVIRTLYTYVHAPVYTTSRLFIFAYSFIFIHICKETESVRDSQRESERERERERESE